MTTATITLDLNADAVSAYNTDSVEEQKKLSLWLKELTVSPSLSALMDDLSDKAEARGLTPAILESILDADTEDVCH